MRTTPLPPLALLLFTSSAARAADDTIELQLPASEIVRLARHAAQQQAPCPSVEELAPGVSIWVDHIEYPSTGPGGDARLRLATDDSTIDLGNGESVQGHIVQVALPTVFELKNDDCVFDTAGCDGADIKFETVLDVVLDADRQLCVLYDSVTAGGALGPIIDAKIRENYPDPPPCVSLGLDDLLGAFDNDVLEVAPAGAAVSTDGTRFAVRIAVTHDGDPGFGDFDAFLDGALGPGADHGGATVFLSQRILRREVHRLMRDALTDGEAADYLSIESGPSSTFNPDVPRLHSEVWADLSVCGVDVFGEVDTTFDYVEIGGRDWLTIDVLDNIEYNEGSLFGCLFAMGIGDPLTAAIVSGVVTGVADGFITGEGVGDPGSVPLFEDASTHQFRTDGTDGEDCTTDADCNGGSCFATTFCLDPSCHDGVQDGAESDVDCGGNSCQPCGVGDMCDDNGDCDERVCGADGVCAAPSCSDGVWNGAESDVDCGDLQGDCPRCGVGANCDDLGDDCEAGLVCDISCGTTCDRACVEPSCTNGVLDGDEEREDCGGPDCAACPACDVLGDHHIRCYAEIDPPAIAMGGVSATPTIDALEPGEPTGVLLTGTFSVPQPPEPTDAQAIFLEPIARSLHYSGDCHGALLDDDGYVGYFTIDGTTNAHMCGVPVPFDDDLGVFTVDGDGAGRLPEDFLATLNVPLDGSSHPFWSAPYDMSVLAQSTAGTVAFTLAAPDQPTTQNQILIATMKALTARIVDCVLDVDNIPYPGHYNPLWDVDPAPDFEVVLTSSRGVQVVVDGGRLSGYEVLVEPPTSVMGLDSVRGAKVYFKADLSVQSRKLRGVSFKSQVLFADKADFRVTHRESLTQLTQASTIQATVPLDRAALPTGYTSGFVRLSLTKAQVSIDTSAVKR